MAARGPRKADQERGVFSVASEELQAISAAIAAEASGWPQVSTRNMFGGIMLYREQLPFAFLPRTRKMMNEDGIWLKFQRRSPALERKLKAEPRILPNVMVHSKKTDDGPRWMGLLLQGQADVHLALEWLARAHAAAKAAG